MEMLVFGIIVLILSIIIHEVAHGYAAYALGDPTAKLEGRLTLNPAPHVDPIGSLILPALLVMTSAGILFGWAKPVPYNPYNLRNQRWGEAIVAVAGVATNLLLAVLFALVARYAYASGMGDFGDLAAIVTLTNLSLGLFNLIPFPPLDGFTVLRGVLPYRMSMAMREFEDRMRAGSIFTLIAFLFIFSYFFAQPFYQFISYIFGILIGA
ncbi:MAG TPA: site-2 protease family protein [Candidatus Paceibacterota bacterium]|nr:site-2 protease family protein [Candidatus Paceibacterota bacterium]